jgi:hypothetical protein
MSQDGERRVEFKATSGPARQTQTRTVLDLDGRTIVSIVEKGCGSWKLCCSRGVVRIGGSMTSSHRQVAQVHDLWARQDKGPGTAAVAGGGADLKTHWLAGWGPLSCMGETTTELGAGVPGGLVPGPGLRV